MSVLATDAAAPRFPLTGAQAGIWLAEQAERGDRVRCIAEYFDIPGAIDVEAFRAAWRATFAETDALRIAVAEAGETLSQVIRPGWRPDVPVVDYRHVPDAHAAAVAWMTEDVARPIDVRGDIHSVVLFHLADDRYLWYQKCHHLAMDGYSGAIFAQRVGARYDALLAGREVTGPGFGRLADLVEDDVRYTASPQHDLDREYWRDLLDGFRPPSRLATVARDAAPGLRRVSATLPAAEHAALRRTHGRALPPTIIAAYGMYHAMLSGVDDILLGLPVTGRKGVVGRQTPGMTSNVVPVRLRPAADLTFRGLVGEVARQVRATLRHQRYRIEELRRDLGLGPDEQIFPGPVVNIMSFPVTYTLGGLPTTARNLSNGPVNDLALAVYDRHDGRGIQLDLDGNTQYYADRDLRAHLDGFLELLRTVTADPEMTALVPVLRPATAPATAPTTAPTIGPATGPTTEPGRPAGDRERLVAALFAEVLGRPEVGVDDSFFEIGGDSITAIAFAARARDAGLPIVLRQLFVAQTPAKIAATIADAPAPTRVRPTPAARRAAELGPAGAGHRSILLRAPAGLDLPGLARRVAALVDRHDMLRARLSPAGDGTMAVGAPGSVDAAALVRRAEAAGLDGPAWTELVTAEATAAARRLDPGSGVLVQAVWLDRGPAPGRVLLVVDGLVADARSGDVLVSDLAAAGRDDPPASFAAWSARAEAAAGEPARLAEMAHWLQVLAEPEPPLGDRGLDRSADTAATGGRLAVPLDRDTAATLRRVAPEALHARVDEVLLSGLVLAVGEWRRRRDPGARSDTVLVDVVRDGRPEPTAAADLSRTVGDFTTTVPVRLPAGPADWSAVVGGDGDPATFVLAVKDVLRGVPGRGEGFGLLRFVNRSTAEALAAAARPQVSFACREPAAGAEPADWAVLPETAALPVSDPATPFGHALVVEAEVGDRPGESEIRPVIRWPLGLLTRAEVAELAELWRVALAAVAAAVAGLRTARHSPTDMTMAGLSQQEIDELEAELEEWA